MILWSYLYIFPLLCFWHLLGRNAEGSDLRTKSDFVTNKLKPGYF